MVTGVAVVKTVAQILSDGQKQELEEELEKIGFNQESREKLD
jgi:hypothetical protein